MPSAVTYVGKRVEGMKGGQSCEPVLPYLDVGHIRSFRNIFAFLNDKDRDILFLIFLSRKKQKDVQRILRRSQPSLCYDIKRIRRRLKFIFYIHSVFDDFLAFLKGVVEENRERASAGVAPAFTDEEVSMLTLMLYTSSFTMVASMMKVSQVRVRYVYNKCLGRIWESERYDMYEVFNIIRRELNIVRRKFGGEKGGRRLPLIM